MRTDRHIGIFLKSVAIVSGLLFYACTDDSEIASNKVETSDVVIFGVGTSNGWLSDVIGSSNESRGRTLALPMECEKGSLPEGEIYMYMIEEDCPTEADTVSVDSRTGEGIIQEGFDTGIFAYLIPKGGEEVTAYDPTATGIQVFMENQSLSAYQENEAAKKYWPGGAWYLQFFAYQPYGENVVTSNANVPSLSYTVPTEVGEQTDYMVGASELLSGDYLKEVEISLQHILSKIQVKVGYIPNGGIVKSVTFKNIQNSGTYSFNSSWELREDKSDYSQSDLSLAVGNTCTPFYLLPQPLSDDAIIEISLEVTTPDPNSEGEAATRKDEYTLTKKLKAFKEIWEKDKQYTYVITTPQQVDVEVTDKVEGRVKKDLVIKNTGLSPAYIRAAIIGNWVQFDEKLDLSNHKGEEITTGKKIVAEWKESDGVFDWGLGDGVEHRQVEYLTSLDKERWVKDENGYFYYTGIVKPGETTPPLFESYTLTASTPMSEAYLELIVAVQAVYPADVGLLWKSEVVKALTIFEDDLN